MGITVETANGFVVGNTMEVAPGTDFDMAAACSMKGAVAVDVGSGICVGSGCGSDFVGSCSCAAIGARSGS